MYYPLFYLAYNPMGNNNFHYLTSVLVYYVAGTMKNRKGNTLLVVYHNIKNYVQEVFLKKSSHYTGYYSYSANFTHIVFPTV
jgi:hypothetical protein